MIGQRWSNFLSGTRGILLAAVLAVSWHTFLPQSLSCRLKHSATGLDVVFLLNTQSAGPYYNYSRVLVNEFIRDVGLQVAQRFADTQFGLATYGDRRDITLQRCYRRVAPLARVNEQSLERLTASVVIQGAGISPEDSIGAIIRSLHDPEMNWGDPTSPSYAKRKRVIVLSTDDTAYWTSNRTIYSLFSSEDLLHGCVVTRPTHVELRGALLQRDASLIVLAADHKNDWNKIRDHVIDSTYDTNSGVCMFSSRTSKPSKKWLQSCYIGHNDPSLSKRFQVESLYIEDPSHVVDLLYRTLGKAVCDTEETLNPNPDPSPRRTTTIPPIETTDAAAAKTAIRPTPISRPVPQSRRAKPPITPPPSPTIVQPTVQTSAPPKTSIPTRYPLTLPTPIPAVSATRPTPASPAVTTTATTTTTTTTSTTGGTTADARSAMFATAGAGVGIIAGGTLWVRHHIKKSKSRLQNNEENDVGDNQGLEDTEASRKTVVEITQEDVEAA